MATCKNCICYMEACKDCICYDVCEASITADENYPERKRSHIVELLCDVGDTVWLLDDSRKFTFKSKVDEIRILSRNRISYHFENAYDWFETSDFGKTVFLSEEEAEQIIGGNEV